MMRLKLLFVVFMIGLVFGCTQDETNYSYIYPDATTEHDISIDINNQSIICVGDLMRINFPLDTMSVWLEVPYTGSTGVNLDIFSPTLPSGLSFVDQNEGIYAPEGDGVLKLYLEGTPEVSGDRYFMFSLTHDLDDDLYYTIYRSSGIYVLAQDEQCDTLEVVSTAVQGNVYLNGATADADVFFNLDYINGWGRKVTFEITDDAGREISLLQSEFTLDYNNDESAQVSVPVQVGMINSVESFGVTIRATYKDSLADSVSVVEGIRIENIQPVNRMIEFLPFVTASKLWTSEVSDNNLLIDYKYGYSNQVNVAVEFTGAQQSQLSAQGGVYTLDGASGTIEIPVRGTPKVDVIEATITLTSDMIEGGSSVINYSTAEMLSYSLSAISAENYPKGSAVWAISDASAVSSDFAGLVSAMEASDEQEIMVIFPNMTTFPDATALTAPFMNLDKSFTVSLPVATHVGDYAFAGSNLRVITATKLKSMGEGAFLGCETLSSISDDALEVVGSYALSGCSSLATINLSKVTSLGSYALSGCSSLISLDLANVRVLESGVLSGLSSLTGLSLATSSGVELCGVYATAFDDTPISGVDLQLGASSGSVSIKINELVCADTSFIFKTINSYFPLTFAHFLEGGIYYESLPEQDTWYIVEDAFALSDTVALYSALRRVLAQDENRRITLDFSSSTFVSIPSYGFSEATVNLAIGAMVMPTTLTTFNQRSMRYLVNMTSITGLDNVLTLGQYVFNKAGITTLILPSAVTLSSYSLNGSRVTNLYLTGSEKIVAFDVNFVSAACDLYLSDTYYDDAEGYYKVDLESNSWNGRTWKGIYRASPQDNGTSATVGDVSVVTFY